MEVSVQLDVRNHSLAVPKPDTDENLLRLYSNGVAVVLFEVETFRSLVGIPLIWEPCHLEYCRKVLM